MLLQLPPMLNTCPSVPIDHKDKSGGSNMEILYILVPSVAIPLAIALLFFFICVCRNNQKSSRPPAPRQPKPVRGQNVEMSMLATAYKPKVESGTVTEYDTQLTSISNLSQHIKVIIFMKVELILN